MIPLTSNTGYGMISSMVSGISRQLTASLAAGSRFRDHACLVRLLALCVGIQILLVLLDLTVSWWKWSDSAAIRRLFNITREDGLASLFAVIQTLFVAMTLWVIWFIHSRQSLASKTQVVGWLLLAIFFSYMVIDDGAKVHERIGTAFKASRGDINFVSYGWQYVLAPVFAISGVLVALFLWCLGKDAIRRSMLFAALALLATAMAIDFVEGVENGYRWLSGASGIEVTTLLHFSKSLEEFMEMLGMSLFLVLFLEYLGQMTHKTEIHIADGQLRLRQSDDESIG